ncbi:MAG: hypothetical protein PHV54_16420 [Tolumonas sp.]|nr:hypothetical protein [Tolumonas sp.]
MNGAKQQYDELVSARLWDKETQINYFLEYAEEYKLSAHFLSYLALKASAVSEPIISSNNYTPEQLIEMLSQSERIATVIKENALVTQAVDPWLAPRVIECIASCISVAVDPDNKQLVQELLTYFNVKHSFLIRSMHKSSSVESDVVSDKYRFGARG